MKRILAGVLVAACAAAGGWLWVRDSSLVAVRDVYVTGVNSSEGPQIRSALRSAALDMTTLHVREDALRTAVSQYPSVKGFEVETDFPRKLTIVVHERAAVAAIESGGGTVAASRDGLVLHGLRARGLPTLRVHSAPAGQRVTDRRTLGALDVAGGAPPELRARIQRLWSGPRGLTLDLRNGPALVFGSGADAARKWVAAVRVLAEPSSAGATYLDLRVPERVAAGGLGPVEPEGDPTVTPDPQAPVESGPTLNP
ncbi:MAG: FtsQ-type POTRA domain-containing protein [Solirubrobacteraceae bacterium]